MNHRIQSGNIAFDEIKFCREPIVGILILRITSFVALKIIGFDPTLVELRDITISMQHSRFCIQVTI
jgi:hypothetical protein